MSIGASHFLIHNVCKKLKDNGVLVVNLGGAPVDSLAGPLQGRIRSYGSLTRSMLLLFRAGLVKETSYRRRSFSRLKEQVHADFPGATMSIPPTLILGTEPRIVVPVARSLARHGIPAFCGGLGAGQSHVRSRAIKRFFSFPAMQANNGQMLHAFLSTLVRDQIDYVLPTSDSTLRFLAQHFDVISQIARPGVLTPPSSIAFSTRALHSMPRAGAVSPFHARLTARPSRTLSVSPPSLRSPSSLNLERS